MSEDAGAAAQGNPGAQGGQESATGPDGAQGAAGGAMQAPATAGANGNGSGGSDDDAAELLATMAAAGDGDGDQDKPEARNAELEHWKQMARKQEQRAKQNSAAAKELEEIRRSRMSEQERLQAERDQYKEEAANNAAQLNRVMAAAAYDLPPELIEHLGGGTEEEISARAEAFAAAINQRATELATAVGGGQQNGQGDGQEQGVQPQPQQPANPFFRNRVPVESLRPGAAPAGDNVARNSNDMFRDMLQRRS